MLGVGAVIAGAVPVALVAVDRSVAQGGGAELERAFAAVGEGPAGAVPTVAIHSNMLWNRSVPPPHENDGGSEPCVSAVMTASVSKPLFEPDGRALCFRDHRYFAPCVVASRW